ncbi:MAG: hypothetical protein WCK39_06785 [Methanomassiliicoccales archaeon]
MVHSRKNALLIVAVAAVLVVAAFSALVLATAHPSSSEEQSGNVSIIARMVNNMTEMQVMVNGLKMQGNVTQTYPLASLRLDVVTTNGLAGSIGLGSMTWNGNVTTNASLMPGYSVHMKREVPGSNDLQKFDFIIIDSSDPFDYGVWTFNIVHVPSGTRVGGLIMPVNGLTCCD